MGKVLVKSAITRQKGKLYYIDAKGNVCEASMNRKGGKKGRKTCASVPKKKAAVKKKSAPKKRTVKKAAPRKTAKRKTTKRK
jgi:hypothetical protein